MYPFVQYDYCQYTLHNANHLVIVVLCLFLATGMLHDTTQQ